MPERNQGNFPAEIHPEEIRVEEVPVYRNRMRHLYKSMAFVGASSLAVVFLGTTHPAINAAYVGITSGVGAVIDIYINNRYFRE